MISDLLITFAPQNEKRLELFRRSLSSLKENTSKTNVRVTVVVDGRSGGMPASIFDNWVDHVILKKENEGLGPALNQGLAYIDSLRKWDDDPPLLTTYVQDDVIYTPGWLERLSAKFMALEKIFNLGFATGVECVEHPVKKVISHDVVLKDWIRATCMMARHEYWMSMLPISKIDPETGRLRGKPNNGLGSSVDWWFIRNHENSVCRTGRTNLVMPGLLAHDGFDSSTWLKSDLPESRKDLENILRSRDKMMP